jgi:hypothetical protein
MLNYNIKEIDMFFSEVQESINMEKYDYKANLLKGVKLLIRLNNKGASKEEIMNYLISYYQNFCSLDSEYNLIFDNFIVDFLADAKGSPWSKNLDFWDDEVSFEDYKSDISKKTP